jgi:uncharacterized membrane protein YccC
VFLLFIFRALNLFTKFTRSDYAAFGFRAACATLAGTLPAFLRSSFSFFTEYRGVWVTITVILGMSPTTGASINGLFGRASGTIVGGLLAMGVWYMVVGHVAGVIVFTLIALALRTIFEFASNDRTILSVAGFPSD